MRDGALCRDAAIGRTTRDAIVADMIGASVMELKTRSLPGAEPALEVIALTAWEPGDHGRTRVDDVSLTVHHGEIVGLFGLIGAGSAAVARALYGSWPGKVDPWCASTAAGPRAPLGTRCGTASDCWNRTAAQR